MTKDEMIVLVSQKIKLVRTECGYTQEKMAETLGISKKTLVQIEKERMKSGWTTAVAVCSLFRSSEVLQTTFGTDPLEIIETIAHDGIHSPKEKTMGGKIWWKEICTNGRYRLQQNVVSHHYRILDTEDYRLYSSFNEEEVKKRFEELTNDYEKYKKVKG